MCFSRFNWPLLQAGADSECFSCFRKQVRPGMSWGLHQHHLEELDTQPLGSTQICWVGVCVFIGCRVFCLSSEFKKHRCGCATFSLSVPPTSHCFISIFGFYGVCFLSVPLFVDRSSRDNAYATVLQGRIKSCTPERLQKSQAFTLKSFTEIRGTS